MMEIHCKDCGGKNFARKEEMYICTSCGREYSAFEVIELTDDVISDQKTFESKKGSITEKTKDFHPKKDKKRLSEKYQTVFFCFSNYNINVSYKAYEP